MTNLNALQDLLAAYAVDDYGDVDYWEIKVNSEVTRVTAADPALHVDPAEAFAAASALVDRILALGYKLRRESTISANTPLQDGDALTFRGVINIGLMPSTD